MRSVPAELLLAAGGALGEDGRAQHFGAPRGELEAAFATCALLDRSDRDRISAGGRDVLDLLHRLSTQDLRSLKPGQGRPAVFTTPKGRIVDRVLVHSLEAGGILLVAGSGRFARVASHLRSYMFAEDASFTDARDETVLLGVIGPDVNRALAVAGLPSPPRWGSVSAALGSSRVHVLGHDGWQSEGASVLARPEDAPVVWRALRTGVESAGGRVAGDQAAEAWRILLGHPEAERELSEQFNPLEVGLLDAVSFDKGCYIGQEVVARLRTYDKVSRRLLGLILGEGARAPARGAEVRSDRRPVGVITSSVVPPGSPRPVAIACVKLRDIRPDLAALEVDTPDGPVACLPVSFPIPLPA